MRAGPAQYKFRKRVFSVSFPPFFQLGDGYSTDFSDVATTIPAANVKPGNGTDYHGIHHHAGNNLLGDHHAAGRIYLPRDNHIASCAGEHHFSARHAIAGFGHSNGDRRRFSELDFAGPPLIASGASYSNTTGGIQGEDSHLCYGRFWVYAGA